MHTVRKQSSMGCNAFQKWLSDSKLLKLYFYKKLSCICYSHTLILLSLLHNGLFPRTANKSVVKEIFYALRAFHSHDIIFPTIIIKSQNSAKFPFEYFQMFNVSLKYRISLVPELCGGITWDRILHWHLISCFLLRNAVGTEAREDRTRVT